jgi:hypothetical protein
LLVPVFGFAAFQLNIHLQALFMWAFALVTVVGLARDRKRHRSNVPLIMSACAVVIIVGTLYTFYDVRILILGYVLLVIAALFNQNAMLGSLNLAVQATGQPTQRNQQHLGGTGANSGDGNRTLGPSQTISVSGRS